MENLLLPQQKQDEYIKQLASKVDVLITHNKMLKAQIIQQATSSSTLLGRLPSKPESNPCEQCNCVTLKEGVEDSEDMTLEKGKEVTMAGSKEKNEEGEPITFREKTASIPQSLSP